MISVFGVISLAQFLGVLKIILIILAVLIVLLVSIYWFELDMLLIRKIEPVFRRLTNKMGSS